MPQSRCFNAIRRSTAWRSSSTVSASTAMTQPTPRMSASQARRSPSIGSVTSVLQINSRWSRGRNRWRSRCWPASRIGSPAGYARSRTSSPTMAPYAASSRIVERREPASSRSTLERGSPHARPTASRLSPAPRRARPSSPRTRASSSWATRIARAIGPSRFVMTGSCLAGLHWPLFARSPGAVQAGLLRAGSSAPNPGLHRTECPIRGRADRWARLQPPYRPLSGRPWPERARFRGSSGRG
jgi:hypothetical protein